MSPPERLDARLDHVAIAVPTWEVGERRWKGELGGGVVAFGRAPMFWSRQLRYANGAKLELLAPPPDAGPDNFVRRFLDRFGAHVHHVTLKVPHLPDALNTLRSGGLEPVDIRMDNDYWHEAFLRPSAVGGLVVQVAWAAGSDEDWARRAGHEPEAPADGAMSLLGPAIEHPDLEAAQHLWRLLGADVSGDQARLVCAWPHSPLRVYLESGPKARATALLAGGAPPAPAGPDGPALRTVPTHT